MNNIEDPEIIELFELDAFGFPLVIKNVKTFRNEKGHRQAWLSLDELRPQVLEALLNSQFAITGNQFRFIRTYLLDCGTAMIAEELEVTKAQVEDWEARDNKRTTMSQMQELMFRASAFLILKQDKTKLEKFMKWIMYNGESFKTPTSEKFEFTEASNFQY